MTLKCFICWAGSVATDAVFVVGGVSVCEEHAEHIDPGSEVMGLVNTDER